MEDAEQVVKKVSKSKTQNEKDHILTNCRIKGFDYLESSAFRFLVETFGYKPNVKDLKLLAKSVSEHLKIYLDREASRRKVVLVKWFDENLDQISPFVKKYVVMEDISGKLIGEPDAVERYERASRNAQ